MKNRAVFFVVLGMLVALAAMMLVPFITPMLVAMVLGYLLFPVYELLGRAVKSEHARAALMVLAVLFLLALPVLLAVVEVNKQTHAALRETNLAGAIEKVNGWLDQSLGRHIPLAENFEAWSSRAREAVLNAAPRMIGAAGATALDLLVLLYTLFYVFSEGREIWADLVSLVPLDAGMKPHLVETIQSTMTGVLYGQVVTAALQAALAGIAYLVFGLPHVLLWTFLTLIGAMIPVVGAAIVWVPLAISRLAAGDRLGGWGLVLYMGVFVSTIDHIVKPRLIAGRSRLHPLAALLGVLGGLHMFGVVGFVLGPVLLGLLSAMLRFYREMPHYKETAGLSPES